MRRSKHAWAGASTIADDGGQWKHQELTNTDTIGTIPLDYLGNPVTGASLSGTTSALFAEDQLFLREDLTPRPACGSTTTASSATTTVRACTWSTTRFLPGPSRAACRRAFRAPSLKENSPSAATNSGGRGCTSLRPLGYVSGTCYMAGNADLKPETSTAGEIGVAYDQHGWEFGLTYFHTDFKNKIDYAPLGKFQGIWWTRMTNIQKARTSGLEGTASLALTKNLNWRNNLTYMREAKNLTTGANLLSTPKLSWYSALGWQVNDQLFGEVSAQYTGKELDAGSLANRPTP